MTYRGIYTWDFAATLRKDAGEKWRPSNGTEGELFQAAHCADCIRWTEDDGCPIAAATFAIDVGHEDYPHEWQIGKDGQPTCTAFSTGNEPDVRQIDIFGEE